MDTSELSMEIHADLPAAVDAFGKCEKSDGTLATDHYLAAINELVRLFHTFGKGVSLALQGVDKSIKSLELLRVKGAGCNYSSFDLLLNHEKHIYMDQNNNKPGTSSVGKLYHYMDFMLEFLTKLEESLDKKESYKATDKVSIYQSTVARYHPKYIQATVKLLLLTAPGRHELLQKLGLGARGEASPREILKEILFEAYPVHEKLCHLLAYSS